MLVLHSLLDHREGVLIFRCWRVNHRGRSRNGRSQSFFARLRFRQSILTHRTCQSHWTSILSVCQIRMLFKLAVAHMARMVHILTSNVAALKAGSLVYDAAFSGLNTAPFFPVYRISHLSILRCSMQVSYLHLLTMLHQTRNIIDCFRTIYILIRKLSWILRAYLTSFDCFFLFIDALFRRLNLLWVKLDEVFEDCLLVVSLCVEGTIRALQHSKIFLLGFARWSGCWSHHSCCLGIFLLI